MVLLSLVCGNNSRSSMQQVTMPKPSARKPVAPSVQASVLLQSRRRCCICYGLNRDTGLKAGQIAHLDHDNSNNGESNLAFLCFEHHDQYDSQTRQSKNLTEAEVRSHLEELTRDIANAFSQPVFFGSAKVSTMTSIEGKYIRVDGGSGEIQLTALPVSPERFHVSGFALWGEHRQYGPNMGELDFSANMSDGVIRHMGAPMLPEYKITIKVLKDCLEVEEDNFMGVHGMNVTFSGKYMK